MLRRDFVPARTAAVFDALSKEPLMSGFILIGGTALSLQIGHRLSEDLDFWLPSSQMPGGRVDGILEGLRMAGLSVQLVTPAWQITQARINGQDLLSISRDYAVDGVKVTFFARNDAPYMHFAELHRIQEPGIPFEMMGSDALFEMKSWLISKRVRSRDLFDLMAMLRDHGKTMRDILDAGRMADTAYSAEYAKEVLVGNVPLDPEDEGFESINLNVELQGIYDFMTERVTEYEVAVAREILRATPPV